MGKVLSFYGFQPSTSFAWMEPGDVYPATTNEAVKNEPNAMMQKKRYPKLKG